MENIREKKNILERANVRGYKIRSIGCKSVSYVKVRVKSVFNVMRFVYREEWTSSNGDIYRRSDLVRGKRERDMRDKKKILFRD